MGTKIGLVNEQIKKKSDKFAKKIKSDMRFKSDYSGDLMSFDWVDEIEEACSHLDIIVRRPKVALVRVENVVKVEKAKKITVDSVKDLAKHTNYISKIDKVTEDVEPSKILDVRNEETYNIYENRFLYTLLYHLDKFIAKKEELLKKFEIKDNKVLEYAASSQTDVDKINIEVKVTSSLLPRSNNDPALEEEIKQVKIRIKKIREYLGSWQKSDMVKELDKAHIPYINPPIKKTNIFLKNAHFKVALKLWDFIMMYDYQNKNNSKNALDSDGDDKLKSLLDHSFMLDYFVMDSISKYKREQKQKLSDYAVILISEEIYKVASLLITNGEKISEDQLIDMVTKQLNDKKNNRLVGSDDVKKKFKSAIDEYMERTQNYL